MSVKKIISCFIFFLLCYSAQGQQGRNVHDHMLIKISDKHLYGEPAEYYEGTPYLKDTFETGYVYINHVKSTAVPMRYNIFEDHVEFQQDDGVYVLKPSAQINKVEIDKYTLVVSEFDKSKNGFFELLEAGKLTLLSRKIINYRKKVEISNVPPKYSKASDTYYIKLSGGKPVKVNNIKKLITSLPDKQNELNAFAESEKLSGRNEDELVKLVKYYNSLQ